MAKRSPVLLYSCGVEWLGLP